LVHIAFSVGNKATVDKLTEVLRKASYTVTSEPRTTGDGYYESCVLDPDGNIVEVTE
jgi:lactoylglutathione lyase